MGWIHGGNGGSGFTAKTGANVAASIEASARLAGDAAREAVLAQVGAIPGLEWEEVCSLGAAHFGTLESFEAAITAARVAAGTAAMEEGIKNGGPLLQPHHVASIRQQMGYKMRYW